MPIKINQTLAIIITILRQYHSFGNITKVQGCSLYNYFQKFFCTFTNLPWFPGVSSNSSENIQGIGNITITAIIVPVCCVVFFIIGALVGAVLQYCVLKKKHTVDTKIKHTVALDQVNEEPDTKYEDISDLQNRGNIDLKENAAYASVQHWRRKKYTILACEDLCSVTLLPHYYFVVLFPATDSYIH